MKIKKIMALVLAITLFCGIFVMPLQAAMPAERIEVLLDSVYCEISLFDDELENYLLKNQARKAGLYSATLGWITECKWYNIYKTDTQGFYKVYGENGYGIIDATGKTILNAEWDWVELNSGVIIVCKNNNYGLMDINGSVIVAPMYDNIGDFYEGFAKAYLNGKVGVINTSGRLVSEIKWNDVQNFSDSMAAVKDSNGLWGFIDNTGKLTIPCKYENVSSFNKGFASVLDGDTVYIIDKQGRKITTSQGELELEKEIDCEGYLAGVRFFGAQNDIAIVKLKGQEMYCYIDCNYNILTESIYKYPVAFNEEDYTLTIVPNRFGVEKYVALTVDRSNGLAVKTVLSEKNTISEVRYGNHVFFKADGRLYNKNGKDLFGMEFDKYIYHYDDSNIINASLKGKYVCVDFDGNVISAFSDYQFYYVNEELYMATADDGRVKLCDSKGKQIAKTAEYAEAFVLEGYICVKNDDGDWGIMDSDCNTIIEPQFDEICDISENMIRYKDKGKYGFVNMETNHIIPAKFSKTDSFVEGMCWVAEKALAGAIDKNGKYIIEPLYWGYNDCTGFGANRCSDSVVPLRKEMYGSYGVLNLKGQKILDFKYEYIGDFSDNGIAVFYDSKGYGLFKLVNNDSTVMPEKIVVNRNDISTYVGSYEVITETVFPANAADLEVSFVSANESVATVDAVGRVYGVAEGTTAIVIISKANPYVMTSVNVIVKGRVFHNANELIAESEWEGQTWLSDYVINHFAEMGINKTVSQLTYGDIRQITEIVIKEMADPGSDIVYHITEIIGEFTNLCTI